MSRIKDYGLMAQLRIAEIINEEQYQKALVFVDGIYYPLVSEPVEDEPKWEQLTIHHSSNGKTKIYYDGVLDNELEAGIPWGISHWVIKPDVYPVAFAGREPVKLKWTPSVHVETIIVCDPHEVAQMKEFEQYMSEWNGDEPDVREYMTFEDWLEGQ